MKKIIFSIVGLVLAIVFTATLFIVLRQAWATARAEREWQLARMGVLRDFGTTSRLEILPLYEETGDQSIYKINQIKQPL